LALKKKVKTADTNRSAASSDGSAEASLIVFEEVDVLFDDDQGFFAALSTLESTTKRPIVMTSTSTSIDGLPDRLPTLNSAFETPSAKEIRDLLRCICLAEGVDLQVNEAENLVERFHCDMRALLMDAQMRFQGEGKLSVLQSFMFRVTVTVVDLSQLDY
jgi:DNA polymerase III delta prime subunit